MISLRQVFIAAVLHGLHCSEQKFLRYHRPGSNNICLFSIYRLLIVSLRRSATYLICDKICFKLLALGVDLAVKFVSIMR